jgi:hypothetical protein
MTQMTQIKYFTSIAAVVVLAGCGGPSTPASSAPASAPAAAPAAAPKAAATITLTEPSEGAFSGHVDTLRWTPVEGADGYKVKLQTGSGRVVWEPTVTTAEAHLPATIALEPEAHTWQVTAMKGATVLVTSNVGRFTVTP